MSMYSICLYTMGCCCTTLSDHSTQGQLPFLGFFYGFVCCCFFLGGGGGGGGVGRTKNGESWKGIILFICKVHYSDFLVVSRG